MSVEQSDRTAEATTTVGTGNLLLIGPVVGYQAFATAFGGDQTVYYGVIADPDGEWEVGRGEYLFSTNELRRDQVYASSNGNSIVPLPSGDKVVYTTRPNQGVLQMRSRQGVEVATQIYAHGSQSANIVEVFGRDGMPVLTVDADGQTTAPTAITADLTITTASDGSFPRLEMVDTTEGADLKLWSFHNSQSDLVLRARDDSGAFMPGYLLLSKTASGLEDMQLVIGTGDAGASSTDASLITRFRGDRRYVRAGTTVAGQLLIDDGTVSAPGLAFGADAGLNSGIYRVSENKIAVALGGNQAVLFDLSGTTMSDPQSAVTREKGDARYVTQANGDARYAQPGRGVTVLGSGRVSSTGSLSVGYGIVTSASKLSTGAYRVNHANTSPVPHVVITPVSSDIRVPMVTSNTGTYFEVRIENPTTSSGTVEDTSFNFVML